MKWPAAAAAIAAVAAALVAQTRRTAPPSNHYVDPAQCAMCHADIAATYAKTGMGRSFYKPSPATAADTTAHPFYHEASNTYIEMIERNGKFFQRRWQKGFDGRETNVDEKQVDYVMGSGNHGRTYLHVTSRGTMQQLPLGWYSDKGGYWAMTPGFDRPDYPGSTRVITYECVSCHDAYPKIPKGHDEVGATPVFTQPLPEGIDCQRCHGPGALHVEAASKPGARAAEIRAAIVNPKKLSGDRELEVCMQCHLETSTQNLPHDLRRFDRAPFSYRPGDPLGDFRLTFDRAGGMGERFEVAQGAYRFRESQCFLKSEGKLLCTTCHDPHNIPRGEAATTHYNQVCQTCHGASVKAGAKAAVFAPMPASPPHSATANCIACHMPKRRTDDAVYIVMTDHSIRARQPAGDLTAPKRETPESETPPYRGEVVPYYPKNMASSTTPPARRQEEAELYGALSQIVEHSNMTRGVPLLESLVEQYKPAQPEFYADLADGLTAMGNVAKGLQYYEAAAQHSPDSALILRRLGSAQMEADQLRQAEATLRRVTTLAPDDAGAWGMLAQVVMRQARAPEAMELFRRSIGIDPEVPEIHISLGSLLLARGDSAGAEKEYRDAMRIEPNLPQAHMNLASVLASRGSAFAAEARFHFERSIKLKPDYAEARLNYARLLYSLHETDEAEKQVAASVATNGRVAEAHELWGLLLGNKNDLAGAVREFGEAVKLRPDLWSAQYELGVALGKSRDFAGAEEHLKLAAGGNDPDVKAAAQDILRRLGR
ncbi:MAG TPA: tetratricopeptide repeat protein [Bryobacteraceae bacterium]|nr:tetratricopeptide repeat protein [Bryobacteraceae bacterium]